MQINLQFSEREYLRAKPKDTTFSEQRTLSLRKFTIHRKSFLRPFGSNACFCREKKRRAAVRAVASGAALPGFILTGIMGQSIPFTLSQCLPFGVRQ